MESIFPLELTSVGFPIDWVHGHLDLFKFKSHLSHMKIEHLALAFLLDNTILVSLMEWILKDLEFLFQLYTLSSLLLK